MTVKFEGLTMNQLAERNAELVTQNEELQRKVEALAADNSRLNDVAKGGAFVMQKALMKYEFGVGMTEQAEHFIRDANEEFEATDAALAGIRAQVWVEAKFYAKSMIESDACEFVDFLFDSKVQQLRGETGL